MLEGEKGEGCWELVQGSKRIRIVTPPGASSWPNSMRRRSQPRRHTNFRAKYSSVFVGVWRQTAGLEGSENSLATNYLSFEDLGGRINVGVKFSDCNQTQQN